MEFNSDREIKRLEREIFYLDKERTSIKKEIWLCNIEKRNLEKERDTSSKKRYLKVLKELYILNSNYNLKTSEIIRRRNIIDSLEVEKTKRHHTIKRVRTKDRHRLENMALVGDYE